LFPWYQAKDPFPKFTSTLFFNVLLPPIILDSALALYDKEWILKFWALQSFVTFCNMRERYLVHL
jgi:hypothetical protein